MKKLQKILALVTAAIITVVSLSVSAFAADTNIVSLKSLEWREGKGTLGIVEGVESGTGKAYKQYTLVFDASNLAAVEYNIGGKYLYFTGTVTAGKAFGANNTNWHTNPDAILNVKIYGDGKELYSANSVTCSSGEKNFKINVGGVKKLRIETGNTGKFPWGIVFIADPKLQKSELKLNESEIKLGTDESFVIKASYKEGKKTNKSPKVSYTTENHDIAKVSSKGKVVGVSAGVTNIKVTYKGVTEKLKVIVKPAAVKGVKLLSATSESLQIEWDKLGAAKSYEVWMYDEDLEEYDKVKTVKNDTSVLLKGLKSGKSYKIKVRASIKDGKKTYTGDFSKEYTFKTK